MRFTYTALDRKGNSISDALDAETSEEAKSILKERGLYLVSLEMNRAEEKEAGTGYFGEIKNRIVSFYFSMGLARERGIFFRQLATLLRAGVPLPQALSDISDQVENRTFRDIVVSLGKNISEGVSFSQALDIHHSVFYPFHVNMARVGENLGSLDHVMERLAEVEEKRNQLNSRIKAALWYPAFMFIFALSVLIFLLVSVVPRIAEMFQQQGRELPLPTTIVLGLSSFITSYWVVLVVLMLAGIFMFQRYYHSEQGRRKIDQFRLQVPLYKGLYTKIIAYRFVENLGVLLGNNVDLIRSLDIVGNLVNNRIISEHIRNTRDRVMEGVSLSTALQKEKFLPRMVTGMITAGEASDQLDDMLVRIGDVYQTEIDLTVNSLTGLIEPLIIIIMGVAIGGIVLSVMLPIMELNLLVQ